MVDRLARLFFVWALLISISPSFGQTPGMRTYSIEDDLPATYLGVLLEDSLGYLWCATFGGGVARFDGRKFRTFDERDGLPSGIVTALQIDFDGKLWASTPEGIARLDGERFRTFRSPTIFGYAGADITQHRDTIYRHFGPPNDLSFGKMVNDSLLEGVDYRFNLPRESHIKRVFAPNQSTLLIATSNGELWKKTDKLRRVATSVYINHFFLVNDHVYILTNSDVCELVDDEIVVRYRNFRGDRLTVSRDFKHGWVQTGRSFRKVLFDVSTWSWSDQASPAEPSYVLIDSHGNDWFATYGNGLVKFFERAFINIGARDKNVTSIAQDRDGNLWVGTRSGVEVLDSKQNPVTTLQFGEPVKDRVNRVLAASDGSIWIASYGGLANIKGDRTKWFTLDDGIKDLVVRGIEEDGSGNIWISYFNAQGLSVFNPARDSRIRNFTDTLTRMVIWDMTYMKALDAMFFCSRLGVYQYSAGKMEKIKMPELEGRIFASMSVFKDSLLLVHVNGAGLAIVDPRNGSYSLISAKDGLSSNTLWFSQGSGDSIWVGSVKGVEIVSLNQQLKVKTIIRHHGLESGLRSGGGTVKAVLFTDNGKFFGLTDGVYEYVGRSTNFSYSFPMHFERILVDSMQVNPFDTASASFGHDQNTIEFLFNRANTASTSARYKYRLKGWDKNWIETQQPRAVLYSNLTPGDFTFEVSATDFLGNWSDNLSYAFTIRPPFYQTRIFRLSAFILTAGMVVLLIRYRTRVKVNQVLIAQQAREEEALRLRKEIGRDFHDEMGNQLARIINYISLLKMNNIKSKSEMLDKAEHSAKYLLSGTKDFLWSIDPVNDNIESLQVHIRDFGDKLLTEKGIDFKFYSTVTTNFRLPFGFTRQVNLIFKEALTNLFKHSRSKDAVLRFDLSHRKLKITLADSGVGISKADEDGGEGLRNMKARAHKIGADLTVSNSTLGCGVVVQFTFPLKIDAYEYH